MLRDIEMAMPKGAETRWPCVGNKPGWPCVGKNGHTKLNLYDVIVYLSEEMSIPSNLISLRSSSVMQSGLSVMRPKVYEPST